MLHHLRAEITSTVGIVATDQNLRVLLPPGCKLVSVAARETTIGWKGIVLALTADDPGQYGTLVGPVNLMAAMQPGIKLPLVWIGEVEVGKGERSYCVATFHSCLTGENLVLDIGVLL